MTLRINPYKVWWWAKKDNYGDILTPLIFDHFNIPYTFTPNAKQANIISIGSIASKARPHTMVLGSGFIDTNDKVEPRADYRFVRGPKSREKILKAGGNCPEIYGDPALLMPLLVEESPKIHDIGIVPHYISYNEAKKLYPNEFVINLQTKDPIETTRQITSCRKIISSSLHGLIVAMAYGIPAAWIEFSDKLVGDNFKFYDFAESLLIKDLKMSDIDNPIFYNGTFDSKSIMKVFEEL